MPDVSARSLVLIIQAVDREITRLMSLPDDAITPAEERGWSMSIRSRTNSKRLMRA